MSDASPQLSLLSISQFDDDAPLFIFLPGMDGTGKLFEAQVGELNGQFNVKCLMIPPDDLTDWEGLTTQVCDLIEAELNRTAFPHVYLCGESFGGCLAIKVAVRSPHLIDRMILVNPASAFNRRLWMTWGSQMVTAIPEALYPASCLALLPLLANLGRMHPNRRRLLLKATQSVTQKSSNWRLALLRNFNVPDAAIAQFSQPVLILASQSDGLLPSMDEARRLARLLPNAQIYALPMSGHACLLETDVNLCKIMDETGFLGDRQGHILSSQSIL